MENQLVEDNQKAKKMLRQFGYKPGQIFSHDDIDEKTRRLFATLKPEERDLLNGRDFEAAEYPEQFFVECLLDDLCNSGVVQVHYRFLPKDKKET